MQRVKIMCKWREHFSNESDSLGDNRKKASSSFKRGVQGSTGRRAQNFPHNEHKYCCHIIGKWWEDPKNWRNRRTVTVTVENLDSSDVIVTLLTLLFIILRSYSITDTRKNTCCLRGKSSGALLDWLCCFRYYTKYMDMDWGDSYLRGTVRSRDLGCYEKYSRVYLVV